MAVVQGCQDAYLPDLHRAITSAANINFFRHTIQINAYVLSEKLINGTLIEHDCVLYQVGPNGLHTEASIELTEFFNKVSPCLLKSFNSLETAEQAGLWTTRHKTIRDSLDELNP